MNLRELYLARFADDTLRQVELEHEDTYYDRVSAVLLRYVVNPHEAYSGWQAYSGGGRNVELALENTCETVSTAAASTGAEVPPMYCGAWFDRGLQARTERTKFGNLVMVNTNLLLALRTLTQAVTLSQASILGSQLVTTADSVESEYVEGGLERLMTQCGQRIDLHDSPWVHVVGGPRETFRRQLMTGALRYVAAHEAGHLARNRPAAGGWLADNGEYQRGATVESIADLEMPRSEVDATRAPASETYADVIAAYIMRTPPAAVGGIDRIGQIMGAMSVLALQAADWWRRAACTDDHLGWTHPFPELRMWMTGWALSVDLREVTGVAGPAERRDRAVVEEENAGCEVLMTRFAEWCTTMLHIDDYQATCRRRGLGNRGIDPGSLAMIYSIDPGMPQQRSGIVDFLTRS